MSRKKNTRQLGSNRGKARLWLERAILANAGWKKGDRFNCRFESGKVIYEKDDDGTRAVAGGEGRPVIDTNTDKLSESLGGASKGTKLNVEVTAKRITITVANVIACLFLMLGSVYNAKAGTDCYDIERDARTCESAGPLVCHPPCRGWGRLKHFAKTRPGERRLAQWSVIKVRRQGGVIEHPASSSLWKACGLPLPGEGFDEFGGWTLEIDQCRFGHRAKKNTWLYIVGATSVPVLPPEREPTACVDRNPRARKDGTKVRLPWITKKEREATPPAFADFLLSIARSAA